MTAPIFFNVKEAREFLLANGYVYTVRKKRGTGKTTARYGNFFKFTELGSVEVKDLGYASPPVGLAPDLRLSDKNLASFFKPLSKYVSESGFRDEREWWEKVNGTPWTEYHIYYVELNTEIKKEPDAEDPLGKLKDAFKDYRASDDEIDELIRSVRERNFDDDEKEPDAETEMKK